MISEGQANYYGSTNTYSYDFGPTGYNFIGNIGERVRGRVRWDHLMKTATGYTTWRAMCLSGVGLVWHAVWPTHHNESNGAGPGSGNRVWRGGDWLDGAFIARCAYRGYDNPNNASTSYGFRCVRGFSFCSFYPLTLLQARAAAKFSRPLCHFAV